MDESICDSILTLQKRPEDRTALSRLLWPTEVEATLMTTVSIGLTLPLDRQYLRQFFVEDDLEIKYPRCRRMANEFAMHLSTRRVTLRFDEKFQHLVRPLLLDVQTPAGSGLFVYPRITGLRTEGSTKFITPIAEVV